MRLIETFCQGLSVSGRTHSTHLVPTKNATGIWMIPLSYGTPHGWLKTWSILELLGASWIRKSDSCNNVKHIHFMPTMKNWWLLWPSNSERLCQHAAEQKCWSPDRIENTEMLCAQQPYHTLIAKYIIKNHNMIPPYINIYHPKVIEHHPISVPDFDHFRKFVATETAETHLIPPLGEETANRGDMRLRGVVLGHLTAESSLEKITWTRQTHILYWVEYEIVRVCNYVVNIIMMHMFG